MIASLHKLDTEWNFTKFDGDSFRVIFSIFLFFLILDSYGIQNKKL